MQLYKTLEVRPAQLEKIYAKLGGTYTFWERLQGKRVGSPMMFYLSGNEQLNDLQNLASDELRINMELLKEGLLIRIAERTTSYFVPLVQEDIVAIDLSKDKKKSYMKLTIKPSLEIHLWGSVDQYYGWSNFLEKTFLEGLSKF